MLPISAIAPIFARLDQHQGAEVDGTEKALRNLTQRFPIVPTETRGRVFYYDRPAIVAIRLTHLAHQFGLNRVLLHPYARFLGAMAPEAVRRAEAGAQFTFQVVARPIGQDCWASWEEPRDDDKLTRAAEAIWRERFNAIELGRFTHHSDLVVQVLRALDRA